MLPIPASSDSAPSTQWDIPLTHLGMPLTQQGRLPCSCRLPVYSSGVMLKLSRNTLAGS